MKAHAKKMGPMKSMIGRMKGSISNRTNSKDPSSRVGTGGAQRSRNMMDAVDKAQSGK